MALHRFDCADEAHAAALGAQLVLTRFRDAANRRFGIALSGGRVAPRFLQQLFVQSRQQGLPLEHADFFWADERCVPPGDRESNYPAARENLLAPLQVVPEHIHRLPGELEPADAVRHALEDWHRWLAESQRPFPNLDCVVLGVGEDGHVASLFPENLAEDLAAPEPFRAVIGSKPPPRRLTMGYPMLWDADTALILATGAAKESVVRDCLEKGLDLPFSRVLDGRTTRRRLTLLVTAF